MSINSYFELTFYLVSKYVDSIYPTKSGFKTIQTTNDKKLKQLELYNKDEKFLILSFTEISNVQSLINLLNLDGRLDNALINWEWFDLDEIKFPINSIDELSKDLIDKFNKKFRLIVDDEKLNSIFDNPNTRNKVAEQEQGPIVEEHTDSESNYAKSPTPEVPYHPTNPVISGGNPSASAASTTNQAFTRNRPSDMPDFEDEYEIKDPGAPTHDTLGHSTHLPPIGSDDLNPPGIPSDPTLRGYLDPLQPPNSNNSGGGMYPTSNHPIFGSQQPGTSGQKGVPPGARYDDPYSEDNLDNLGQGLPSNLRGPGGAPFDPNQGPGGPGNFGNFGPPGGGAPGL
ncbi:uncharacterized protein KGF55_005480 [Candida pseudojiufengensis]|uniref:uncharacterized protein n=1 Tax=Candida pseudojiufengensis TaxID=497109 RepID=UPI002225503F|nr:uncharacterized protein KGF55_005480 [Candida pseudojiufengensis]KAI5959137.1 hypothetical protein KGF55_005480 [Candida pseudojiufengensis]